jgi:hypothetical protein
MNGYDISGRDYPVVFVYGKSETGKSNVGLAAILQDQKHAFGITVRKSPRLSPSSFFTDDEYERNKEIINHDLEFLKRVAYGRKIMFPSSGIGSGQDMMNITAPKTFAYLSAMLNQMFGIVNGDQTMYAKIQSDLARQPTKQRYSPGDIKRGDGIVFKKIGERLQGMVIDIINEGAPTEVYKVKLSDDTIRMLQTINIRTASNKIPTEVMVLPRDIVSKIIDLPLRGSKHKISSDIIDIDRKKSRKVKSKLIRKPIKKIIKKSPVKKCKCRK